MLHSFERLLSIYILLLQNTGSIPHVVLIQYILEPVLHPIVFASDTYLISPTGNHKLGLYESAFFCYYWVTYILNHMMILHKYCSV